MHRSQSGSFKEYMHNERCCQWEELTKLRNDFAAISYKMKQESVVRRAEAEKSVALIFRWRQLNESFTRLYTMLNSYKSIGGDVFLNINNTNK